jgi:hypothetical protein
MPEDDQKRYNSYGHLRPESAFIDRKFIVYRPTGLTKSGAHRPPEVLTTLVVIDFGLEARSGAWLLLRDDQYAQELRLTYVPRQLWTYPIFASVPPRLMVRWDARRMPDGKIWRSLSAAILVKTKNRSDFYSMGNTYIETPKNFKRLFPEVSGQFVF